MTKKKRPPYNQNAMIRGAIRRTFSRSPIVREVLMDGRREVPKYNKDGTLAKKPAVQYQCQVCSSWVSSTMIAVDHVIPVISTEDGFKGWDIFVERLFCNKDNLQRICDPCHDTKTAKERFERNMKKDYELINSLEMYGCADYKKYIKDALKKFTKKKLKTYPKDFQDRVAALRARISKTV